MLGFSIQWVRAENVLYVCFSFLGVLFFFSHYYYCNTKIIIMHYIAYDKKQCTDVFIIGLIIYNNQYTYQETRE